MKDYEREDIAKGAIVICFTIAVLATCALLLSNREERKDQKLKTKCNTMCEILQGENVDYGYKHRSIGCASAAVEFCMCRSTNWLTIIEDAKISSTDTVCQMTVGSQGEN